MSAAPVATHTAPTGGDSWRFLILGALFGMVLLKSEVVSWFRIQEMFRFDSFHMYGIIGSAIGVVVVGRLMMGKSRVREPARPRHVLGGITFGLGWGLAGACPGPSYALIGSGMTSYIIVLASGLVGTWAYGVVLARSTPAAPQPTRAHEGA